jgi:hypothetical protein
MQQWTEQQIRLSLDGTFTFMRETPAGVRFYTREVALDYLPSFDPPPDDPPRARLPGPSPRWTRAEEATLIELCRNGVSMQAAAGIMKRGVKMLRLRRRALADMGVI